MSLKYVVIEWLTNCFKLISAITNYSKVLPQVRVLVHTYIWNQVQPEDVCKIPRRQVIIRSNRHLDGLGPKEQDMAFMTSSMLRIKYNLHHPSFYVIRKEGFLGFEYIFDQSQTLCLMLGKACQCDLTNIKYTHLRYNLFMPFWILTFKRRYKCCCMHLYISLSLSKTI